MKGVTEFIHLTISGLAILISIFAGLTAGAHGENKPGPHGGQIRMPGAFHTEVLARPDGFQVYLLDINFQKPIVSKSNVKATLKSDGEIVNLKCETHPDHFFCPVTIPPKAGILLIEATRESAIGSVAQYNLPF